MVVVGGGAGKKRESKLIFDTRMALGDTHYDCPPQQKSTGGKADPAHPPTETLDVFERRLQASLDVEGRKSTKED